MEKLIEKAVELLDKKYNLPNKGFLAGGALANVINKLKWGGKCVINDIDIFCVDMIKPHNISDNIKKNIPSTNTTIKSSIEYKIDTYENRLFISKKVKGDNYITVKTSERDDIYNYIKFDTNNLDYNLFLETFDINCTQVGYDLENKTVYYTKDFEEYVNTKELKVSLANTPSHTAMRILKKRDELDAKLNIENEMKFLAYSNSPNIIGRRRVFFSTKYKELYDKYADILNEYFDLTFTEGVKYLKDENNNILDFNINSDVYKNQKTEKFPLYRLIPKGWSNNSSMILNKVDMTNITLDDYQFYWRKIKDDTNKKIIWKFFPQFYKDESYITDYPIEKTSQYIHFLSKISDLFKKYPPLVLWLKNKNLAEQLKYLKPIIDICDENKDYYDILRFHPTIIDYENKEELKDKLLIYKLRYRKNIGLYKKSLSENNCFNF